MSFSFSSHLTAKNTETGDAVMFCRVFCHVGYKENRARLFSVGDGWTRRLLLSE